MKRILHIASFRGNVGDILNHKGFYKIFDEKFTGFDVTQIEIREFYRSAQKQRFFDKKFAEYVNDFDMLILGGGGFFDARWNYSATGTTCNISAEFIDSVKIPVLVNAMGYHEYPGETTTDVCEKFGAFIKKISGCSNWLVTFRNDGSVERIYKRYGIIPNIYKVPDNGFWGLYESGLSFIYDSMPKPCVGMCITNDLFCKEYNVDVTEETFNKNIARFIETIISDYDVVFFPHTPQDISVINKLFVNLPENVKRNNIRVAPYWAGSDFAVNQIAYYYKMCSCVIGMRFHSVILALQLGIPTIALSGHAQIEGLLQDLAIENYCVRVCGNEYIDKLYHIISHIDALKFNQDLHKVYCRLHEMKNSYVGLVKDNLLNK